jgi:hypothetical protein
MFYRIAVNRNSRFQVQLTLSMSTQPQCKPSHCSKTSSQHNDISVSKTVVDGKALLLQSIFPKPQPQHLISSKCKTVGQSPPTQCRATWRRRCLVPWTLLKPCPNCSQRLSRSENKCRVVSRNLLFSRGRCCSNLREREGNAGVSVLPRSPTMNAGSIPYLRHKSIHSHHDHRLTRHPH